MIVFAGLLAGNDGVPDPELCHQLSAGLSRDPGDVPVIVQQGSFFLAAVGIGASAADSIRREEARVTLLAGDPLVGAAGGDLSALHSASPGELEQVLRCARGPFCLVRWSAEAGLTLASDKLGLRPLYITQAKDAVVFASSLRILEAATRIPKSLDLRGLTQYAALGYGLGTRTPYSGVEMLSWGTIAIAGPARNERLRYWNWAQSGSADETEEQLVRRIHATFLDAVRLRLGSARTSVAFLSGGLDSRCVVAALRQLGAEVHTYNFARGGTQDAVFAAQFARAVGTSHAHMPMKPTFPGWSDLMARALARTAPAGTEDLAAVWSGDGGSVGLGHVHLEKNVVAALRADRLHEALDCFIGNMGAIVPRYFFRSPLSDPLATAVHDGIFEEIEAIPIDDQVRRFHVFLLLSDQRRHLWEHYEHIDINRIALHLPFFDSVFLQTIVSAPAAPFLYHRLYHKFLRRFPSPLLTVPWQTYPGHEPCPLPIPAHLPDQWELASTWRDRRSVRERFRGAARLLWPRGFPFAVLQWPALLAATMLYGLGIRDTSNRINLARQIRRYCEVARG